MTTQYILKHKNGTFQYIVKYINNNTFYYKDREMTILHREDGPAVEWRSGGKEWFINGKRHREDGPAIEYAASGDKYWYCHGKLHREDGPAIKYGYGSKLWYLNGKLVSEEQHEKLKVMAQIYTDERRGEAVSVYVPTQSAIQAADEKKRKQEANDQISMSMGYL